MFALSVYLGARLVVVSWRRAGAVVSLMALFRPGLLVAARCRYGAPSRREDQPPHVGWSKRGGGGLLCGCASTIPFVSGIQVTARISAIALMAFALLVAARWSPASSRRGAWSRRCCEWPSEAPNRYAIRPGARAAPHERGIGRPCRMSRRAATRREGEAAFSRKPRCAHGAINGA